MTSIILAIEEKSSYIRYPQDFSLVNEAREKLEGMIDWFYKKYDLDKKPRTYRRVARKVYLELAKSKKTDRIENSGDSQEDAWLCKTRSWLYRGLHG